MSLLWVCTIVDTKVTAIVHIDFTKNLFHSNVNFPSKNRLNFWLFECRNSTVTGDPIIRPLWWLDPEDPNSQTVSDQFLVGDDLLVAPVVQQGATSRNVVIPSGSWEDQLRGGLIQGPTVLEDYAVQLEELAYFVRAESSLTK
jgi:alpha-glucosidase (family GH31 glycosyl hydrolase)